MLFVLRVTWRWLVVARRLQRIHRLAARENLLTQDLTRDPTSARQTVTTRGPHREGREGVLRNVHDVLFQTMQISRPTVKRV